MTISLQQKIIAVAASLIAIVAFGWCMRHEGEKRGAVDQKLEANAGQVKELKLEAVVVDRAAAIEVKKSVAKKAEYHAARAKVELKGDTVFADGKEVVLPSVAALIKVA